MPYTGDPRVLFAAERTLRPRPDRNARSSLGLGVTHIGVWLNVIIALIATAFAVRFVLPAH